MNALPLFLSVRGVKAVIAGGGAAAANKARLLLAAGAEVILIAPALDEALVAEFGPRATLVEDTPAPADFAAARIAVIAVESDTEAARLSAAARGAGALVNVVDRPALCDFTFPSIVDRGEVVVAIGTDGAAPVLARRLRATLEALLPARLGALAAFARRFRPDASRLPPPIRRRFWENVFAGPVADHVLGGDEAAGEAALRRALSDAGAARPRGVVHIVGAGPGDPELLTVKALRLLGEADVIVHDRLVSDAVLALARRDAERLYVGKRRGDHSVPQDEIGALLVSLARAGKRVVRLKGGDPFIFGRGGEELEALRAAGVDVFVTPGVTAALGCAASAGLALTHRGVAQAVTLVTGHGADDGAPDVDWSALAALGHTLVVYMGVGRAGEIARQLVAAGRAPSTPVAVIENGTRPDERVLSGDLAGLGALVDGARVEGPALLVIGEVAAFASEARALVERLAA